VAPPRWLVDEMLGRLARYLRFVGCDAAYERGVSDDELLAQAQREDRLLLTRDRALAARSPRALLLRSSEVGTQWAEVRAAFPDLPTTPTFERCSLCNGTLRPAPAGRPAVDARGRPWSGAPPERLFACLDCGHLFWDGSHTERIRRQLQVWSSGGAL